MKSPWTKKNPWMSMFLSGANAVAGSARGRASGHAKRMATATMVEGIRQVAGLWGAPAAGRKGKKKRR